MADAKEREQQGLDQPGRYRVVGPFGVLGHAPGSVFEAVIAADQEAILIESGALARAPANAALRDEPAAPTAARLADELATQSPASPTISDEKER